MAKAKTAEEEHDPGETQQQLAERQAAPAEQKSAPASVQAIASTHAEAASNRVLQPRRVVLAESVFNNWHVIVDPGVTREDLERPSFWCHHTKMLRRRDIVHVDCADGSFDAELKVRAVGPKDVLMHVRRFDVLEVVAPNALDLPSGYAINWAGDISKWRVLRGRDLIRDGFETQGHAQSWLGTHLQSLQR